MKLSNLYLGFPIVIIPIMEALILNKQHNIKDLKVLTIMSLFKSTLPVMASTYTLFNNNPREFVNQSYNICSKLLVFNTVFTHVLPLFKYDSTNLALKWALNIYCISLPSLILASRSKNIKDEGGKCVALGISAGILYNILNKFLDSNINVVSL